MSDARARICRCGAPEDADPHPCHGQAYTCRRPATQRFQTYLAAIPGAQMKLGAYETWACDECWAQFVAITRKD